MALGCYNGEGAIYLGKCSIAPYFSNTDIRRESYKLDVARYKKKYQIESLTFSLI